MRIRTVVVALTLLGSVAACTGGGDTETSAPAEVVTETVEVPGETVTERVEVEVVPDACLDAIAAAEDIGRAQYRFLNQVVKYPNLLRRSIEAGLTADSALLSGITADLEDMTTKFNRITEDTTASVDAFNDAKVGCRAASN